MSVATLRSDAPRLNALPGRLPRHQRSDGTLVLSFARAGETTVLAELDQRSPCRALFPRPQHGEPPLAVLVNTAGGLAGGDRIALSVTVGAGAAATVTSQAAEKVYRSLGPDARIETRLGVGEDAHLEWLPQESILFDGACLDRSLVATIAETGRLLACEMIAFGRAARGETMTGGRLREVWRIERGGRLLWFDRLGLSGGMAARLDGPGFGGARALATVVYAGPEAKALLPMVRDAVAAEAGGATLVNDVLIARLLGKEPSRVRDGLARLIGRLRRAGVPPLWIQ